MAITRIPAARAAPIPCSSPRLPHTGWDSLRARGRRRGTRRGRACPFGPPRGIPPPRSWRQAQRVERPAHDQPVQPERLGREPALQAAEGGGVGVEQQRGEQAAHPGALGLQLLRAGGAHGDVQPTRNSRPSPQASRAARSRASAAATSTCGSASRPRSASTRRLDSRRASCRRSRSAATCGGNGSTWTATSTAPGWVSSGSSQPGPTSRG
jgi:hypothetical protein